MYSNENNIVFICDNHYRLSLRLNCACSSSTFLQNKYSHFLQHKNYFGTIQWMSLQSENTTYKAGTRLHYAFGDNVVFNLFGRKKWFVIDPKFINEFKCHSSSVFDEI